MINTEWKMVQLSTCHIPVLYSAMKMTNPAENPKPKPAPSPKAHVGCTPHTLWE